MLYIPDEGAWSGSGENKVTPSDMFEYKKFNNIPVDPTAPIPTKIPLSAEETVQQKINLIRKLNHLEKKGIKLTKKYTMEDPLAAIKGEYEMLKKEKEKRKKERRKMKEKRKTKKQERNKEEGRNGKEKGEKAKKKKRK